MKVINADDMSDTDLENIDEIVDKDGWVNIIFEGENSIRNFSNKEYILTILMNCSDNTYFAQIFD